MKFVSAGILVILTYFSTIQATAGTQGSEFPDVRDGVFIVKFTSEISDNISADDEGQTGSPELDALLGDIGCYRIERTFPHCLPPKPGGSDLTRIYTVYFNFEAESGSSYPVVRKICDDLEKLNGIEYAEPWLIEKPDMEYNDPRRMSQYGIDVVQTRKAHDIAIGDKNIPVAIVDTGMDMDHPDLIGNLWINPGEDLNGDGVIQQEEINGRDDDNNGKRDDFHGWDFVDEDNDPEDFPLDYEAAGHGTHVAGISSAATNNNEGVASVGYSCGIIPIRAGAQGIAFGYNGIEYAVRTGAKVINCSWGGGWYVEYAQEIVNYAWENDVIVVAAAGNDSSDELHYPSGYDNAVAVAATNSGDRVAGFSNYGEWVDISAPGYQVFATVVRARYGSKSGTSMASPYTAGVAILLRAAYPALSAEEILDLLLRGADNIDELNPGYEGLLGVGRINAYNSIDLGPRPRLTVGEPEFISDDNENGRPDPGEQVELVFTFENDWEELPAEGLQAFISSTDPSLNITTGVVDLPDILPGEDFTNDDNPFVIEVSADSMAHTSNLSLAVVSYNRLTAVRDTFTVIVGQPDVLIVDDDGGVHYQGYYCQTLANTNHGWTCWDVSLLGSPSSEDLLGYEMVIWTGADTYEPFDEDERNALTEALDQGIDVILTGSRIGDDPDNRDMLAQYFGAEHDRDSVVAATVEGLPGNRPLSDDVQMYLFGDGGLEIGRMSPSTMNPVNGGDSLAVYYMRERLEGLAAVYRYDPESGSKTVYFGFPFEGVSDVVTTQEEAFNQIYDWFLSNTSVPGWKSETPSEFRLYPAYPNPFNSTTRLSFSLPQTADVRAVLYATTGRRMGELISGRFDAGRHSLVISGDNYATGVYILRVNAGDIVRTKKLVLIK